MEGQENGGKCFWPSIIVQKDKKCFNLFIFFLIITCLKIKCFISILTIFFLFLFFLFLEKKICSFLLLLLLLPLIIISFFLHFYFFLRGSKLIFFFFLKMATFLFYLPHIIRCNWKALSFDTENIIIFFISKKKKRNLYFIFKFWRKSNK